MLRRISFEVRTVFELVEKALELRSQTSQDFKIEFFGQEVRVSPGLTRTSLLHELISNQSTSRHIKTD